MCALYIYNMGTEVRHGVSDSGVAFRTKRSYIGGDNQGMLIPPHDFTLFPDAILGPTSRSPNRPTVSHILDKVGTSYCRKFNLHSHAKQEEETDRLQQTQLREENQMFEKALLHEQDLNTTASPPPMEKGCWLMYVLRLPPKKWRTTFYINGAKHSSMKIGVPVTFVCRSARTFTWPAWRSNTAFNR